MSKLPRKIKVVIADDEPLIQEALAFEFEIQGSEVHCFGNGREAFEFIKDALNQEMPVDVVLTDLRMAGGDGTELLARIRDELSSGPKVILMSGFSDVDLSWPAHLPKPDAILMKPFRLSDMIVAVGKLV